ncbi:MAG TPA: PH domain-containing protein [Blastocatellia bacterium]|nr:PH domain-containing protein [Blastocatellia bacterium]
MRQETRPVQESLSSDSEFRPLDPRVIGLWRLTDFIGYGVLLVMLLAGAAIWEAQRPGMWRWLLPAWVALALACGALSYWRPGRVYRAWGYRIDAKVLETRSGTIFRVRRLLPLSRLQHVDLERGPFERAFGLASLVLHTAGTHAARIEIPGLDADEAARLRDHLVEIGGDDAV